MYNLSSLNDSTSHPPSVPDLINLVALCIVNALFAISGIFLNFLVILSFRYSSLLRRKLCYFLILVLACVDLAVVSLVHPLLILSSVAKYMGKNFGIFIKICERTIHLLCGFSLFTLLTMNIERYLAIIHPHFYQRSVTKRKILGLIAIFWVFEITEWVLSFKTILYENVAVVVITVLVFIVIGSINYKIFVIVRKIRLYDASLARSFTSIDEATYRNRLVVLKTVSTCILVVAVFFVFVCPMAFYFVLYTLQKESMSENSFAYFRLWAETLLTMNSTFNCLVFFWKNKALRQEGKKLLKCFGCLGR